MVGEQPNLFYLKGGGGERTNRVGLGVQPEGAAVVSPQPIW